MRRLRRCARTFALVGLTVAGLGGAPAWAVDAWPDLTHVTAALHGGSISDRREAVEALEPFAAADAEPLLRAALSDESVLVRRAAIAALGRRHSRVAPELRALLTNPDPSLRAAAAAALAQVSCDPGEAANVAAALERSLGDSDPAVRREAIVTFTARSSLVSPLLHPALTGRLDDSQPEVRQAAAVALGQLNVKSAVIPLIGRVGDGAREVRVAAAGALALLGDVRAQPSVLRLLRDPVDEVRVAAARALGAVGGEMAVPALGELLASHTVSEPLRAYAAFALARIARRSADAATVDAALALLCDGLSEPSRRTLSFEALSGAGAGALPTVVSRLEASDGTGDEVLYLVRLLGTVGDGSVVAPLAREIDRARLPEAVLASAVAALSRRVTGAALAPFDHPVATWLGSNDPTVRAHAATVLAARGDDSAGPTWLQLLSDASSEVRAIALDALARHSVNATATAGTEARLEALARGSSAQAVRENDVQAVRAVDALGELGMRGSHHAIPLLVDLLSLPGASARTLRRHASAVLGRWADRAAVTPLLHQLRSLPAGDERLVESARALGLVLRGSRDAVARDLLLALAERQGPGTIEPACEAIDALAALGDPEATGRLEGVLRRDEATVRIRVVAALGALAVHTSDRPPIVRVLSARLADDRDARVRAEAAFSLGLAAGGSDALARARFSPDINLRLTVSAALALQNRRDLLAPLLTDEDHDVRANAGLAGAPSGSDFLAIDRVDFDGAAFSDDGGAERVRLSDGLTRTLFVDGRGTLRQEAIPAGSVSLP